VLFTGDGGKTWSGGEGGAAGRYFSTMAYTGSAIVAAGSAGDFRWTKESGWRRESDENFNAIAFTNSRLGWAVGPNGKVARKGG
jgi:photosystem II stability/assembly factor-like uncharacterized protein